MPINLSTTEYTNNSLRNSNSGMYVSGGSLSGSIKVNVNAGTLKSGETISGEVVSIDGKNITLKLSDGQNVNARLDGNTNLMLGKILSFEVNTSDDGKSVLLRPLYSNLNGNNTVTAALKAAYMPLTDSNISMTQTMIEEGMSISRDSLNDMARIVNSVPNANPSTVVIMDKMGLPINELSVTQFENYRNFEHQIINDVQDLAEGLTSAISEFASEGTINDVNGSIGSEVSTVVNADASAGMNNISELLSVIDTSLIETDEAVIQETVAFAENISNSEPAMKTSADVILDANGKEVASETIEAEEKTEGKQAASATNQVETVPEDKASSVKTPFSFKNTVLSNITDKIKNIFPASENNNVEDTSSSAGERYNSIKLLNDLSGYTGKTIPFSADNSEIVNTLKEIVDYANANQSLPSDKSELLKKISELFNNNDIKQIISNAVKDQLTIAPQKVAKEGEVEELYSRISKISQKLMEISENSSSSNMGKVFESAQNLNNNVNFMNEVNQFVNYVQLPLKMYGENAHGDLYVYSNKKNLQNNDGNLTALLHLDMEHLGPMDVYVAMKEHVNVTTNFRLSSEELLDFIAENINLLDERLTAKGYNMSTNVTLTDKFVGKDTSIAEEFLKESPEDGSVNRNMTFVQFDVRA